MQPAILIPSDPLRPSASPPSPLRERVDDFLANLQGWVRGAPDSPPWRPRPVFAPFLDRLGALLHGAHGDPACARPQQIELAAPGAYGPLPRIDDLVGLPVQTARELVELRGGSVRITNDGPMTRDLQLHRVNLTAGLDGDVVQASRG